MNTTKKAQTQKPSAPKKPTRVKAGAPLAHGVGRRKRAVARVWLRRGKGIVTINGEVANKYFDTDFNRDKVAQPLKIFSHGSNYDIDATVHGGGVNGQADAVKLGIARAIVASDEKARKEFRKYRLLTCDSRNKERKKYGQRGARRKFQFVKR